ncbi:MAG: mismatch-specific DNA-glycosylase [Armatimonadetes bacterium]|nr:mismatch-specific DNA-glycosylase [Armatimonadota bacterium]
MGINPGLKSARVGHYYAGPGNLFWHCLYHSRLTPVLLTYQEDYRLLEFGLGVMDCIPRPTRSASDLRLREFAAAAPVLLVRVERCAPRILCFNGLTGYRGCIDPHARLGRQARLLGPAVAFVVPSTSAANAGFSRQERLDWFCRLRELRDELLPGSG